MDRVSARRETRQNRRITAALGERECTHAVARLREGVGERLCAPVVVDFQEAAGAIEKREPWIRDRAGHAECFERRPGAADEERALSGSREHAAENQRVVAGAG